MSKPERSAKKKRIVIKETIPILEEYTDLYFRAKYLEGYFDMARSTLLRVFLPPGEGPDETESDEKVTELEVKFEGEEEGKPTIYASRVERTAVFMPRKVTPRLESFLRDKGMEGLIYLSPPSSSLYVRGGPELNEKMSLQAQGDFISKYKEFTTLTPDPFLEETLAVNGKLLAQDCWETRRELFKIKEEMSSMKPHLRKALPKIDEVSYHYSKKGHNFVFNVQHNKGGVKMISAAQFAAVFGEDALIAFGAERTRVSFRVESEAERAKRLSQKRERDEERARQEEDRRALKREQDKLTLEYLQGHIFGQM